MRYEEYPNTLLDLCLAAPVDPNNPIRTIGGKIIKMATITYVTPNCTVCEKSSSIDLDSEDIARWKEGSLIQDVWPDMTPEDREILISGTHPECWTALFTEIETNEAFYSDVFDIT